MSHAAANNAQDLVIEKINCSQLEGTDPALVQFFQNIPNNQIVVGEYQKGQRKNQLMAVRMGQDVMVGHFDTNIELPRPMPADIKAVVLNVYPHAHIKDFTRDQRLHEIRNNDYDFVLAEVVEATQEERLNHNLKLFSEAVAQMQGKTSAFGLFSWKKTPVANEAAAQVTPVNKIK